MKRRLSLPVRATLFVALLVSTSHAFAQDATAGDLDARLDRLVASLEGERVTHHVPGLGIVVVKGDEVILARGLGLADLERQRPVTNETVFSIGSTTKAFTATLTAMLAEEGTVRWDDPVTDHLPYFTLRPHGVADGEVVTLRDMASHRTGFTRMRVLYAGGHAGRALVLHAAANAEPLAGFRERFLYTNVLYLALGEAVAEAAGSDWDALLAERLFTPLGMTGAITSHAAALAEERRAVGYEWDAEQEIHLRVPLRNVDAIGPAGGVSANILDLGRWLRFQLGRGEIDGRRLLSEEGHAETWESHINVGPGVDYGLGWMLRTWNGSRVVEHGGNVDGFSCVVAMLPEENLGFVLVANASAAPVQDAMGLVWETLLGEAHAEAEATEDAVDYRPHLGEYRANFGSHVDDTFRVVEQDGHAALDLAGRLTVTLQAPDAEGRWGFVQSPGSAVSFVTDAEGRTVEMILHQRGTDITLPRLGLELPPVIPLADLEKFLGSYRTDDGTIFEVVIKNDRLALDAPGPKIYQLRPPDEEGRWLFRVVDFIFVTFDENEAGEVVAMTFSQAGEITPMRRVAEEPGRERPTVERILTLRQEDARREAWAEVGAIRFRGTVRVLHSGLEGAFTTIAANDGRHRRDQDFGPFGTSRLIGDHDLSWVVDLNGRADALRGIYHARMRRESPAAIFGPWKAYYSSIAYVRTETFEGRNVHVLRMGGDDLPEFVYRVDVENGDVLSADFVLVSPSILVRMVTTIRYEDYREFAGLRIPHRITTFNELAGRVVFEIEEIAAVPSLDEVSFRPPETDER